MMNKKEDQAIYNQYPDYLQYSDQKDINGLPWFLNLFEDSF